jgi:hypothetical protein
MTRSVPHNIPRLHEQTRVWEELPLTLICSLKRRKTALCLYNEVKRLLLYTFRSHGGINCDFDCLQLGRSY